MEPGVYILASQRNRTLYIGVTANLAERVWAHKSGLSDGFTKKYNVPLLVWYEYHESMLDAIRREKMLKEWRRLGKYG